MLILALGGVLLGFVFLVVSLVTENSTWAWGCIVACVAAGVVLVVDARRRRQGRTAPSGDAPAVLVAPDADPSPAPVADAENTPTADAAPTEVIAVPEARDEQPTTVLTKAEPVDPEPSAPEPSTPEPAPSTPAPEAAAEPVAESVVAPEPVPESAVQVPETVVETPVAPAPVVESSAEPDEEDVDASDALVVAGLEQDVLVVDEHPRFHVAACTWLVGRETMSLPAREAVELGFSPCSRCAPSRTLAALTRA